MNYPPPTAYSGMVGASKFTGERLTDVLRPLLGLTSPHEAVSLVPNERIRSPSALMFNAAFTSLLPSRHKTMELNCRYVELCF